MSDFSVIKKIVSDYLEKDSTGHDIHHVERVFNTALHIRKEENRGDKDVIGYAALLHDIMRPWEKKTGKSHFGAEALEIIKGIMLDANTPQALIAPVLDVIALHDVYDWTTKVEKSIELQIVQDADNLDAIGAIGIGRAFAFGGSIGRAMYVPDENLTFDQDFVEDPAIKTTTIAHFHEKLLKLKTNMNTPIGIKMAEARHLCMEEFLAEFFAEWKGER